MIGAENKMEDSNWGRPPPPKKEHVPSEYQKAIFDDFRSSKDSTVVQARAGSGKTTTIVEGLGYSPDYSDTMLCAFNKTIQTELANRAPKHVEVKTLHSIGYGALARKFGKFKVEQYRDKTRHIASEIMKNQGLTPTFEQLAAIAKLVGLAKNTLVDKVEDLVYLAEDFGVDEPEFTADVMAPIAHDTLVKSLENTSVIEFDDMIWFPYKFDLKLKLFDLVCVDEAQDLNPAQIWMVKRMVRREGRLVAVGDDKQAIYGWRGADSAAMYRIMEGFNAKTLPLTVSYRCPKSVVRLAQRYVPDFEWWEGSEEGLVEHTNRVKMFEQAKPGEFILSRKNAPLASTCLNFLKRNIPAVIAGRDIGASLAALVKKSETEDVDELELWLEDYVAAEQERLSKSRRENQMELVYDKVEAIRAFMEGERKVSRVVERILALFTDDNPHTKIVCSTVHRAKGLERDKVWLLADTFGKLDMPNAPEEQNIYYVGITRAKRELMLVLG